MPAVLLRVAWFDALYGDAEAQPPDGELGEVEEGIGAGEGHAVIGADGGRQAALAEQMLEGGNGGILADRVERLAQQQIAGGVVGDGERVAVLGVAEPELAFEIGTPEIVGRRPGGKAGCPGRGGGGGPDG